MKQVVWTIPALHELEEIADYIALDNESAARKLVREIYELVGQLSTLPESGKPLTFVEGSIYREIVHPPCRVFYRIEAEVIYIVLVIRSEQVLHRDVLLTR